MLWFSTQGIFFLPVKIRPKYFWDLRVDMCFIQLNLSAAILKIASKLIVEFRVLGRRKQEALRTNLCSTGSSRGCRVVGGSAELLAILSSNSRS